MKPALPSTWRWVPIGRVLERRRNLVNPADDPDRSYGSVGLEDIAGDGVGEVAVQTLDGTQLASTKAVFSVGELLYGRLRPYLNKAAIAPCDGVCSTEIWVFRPTPSIDIRYAFFCVISPLVLDRVARITQGANLPRVEAEAFDRLEIPLPPLSEQRWIVSMLEEARAIRRLHRQANDLAAQLIPVIFHEMFGDPSLAEHISLGRLMAQSPQNGIYKPSDQYGEGTRIIRIADFYGGKITDVESLQRVRLSQKEIEIYGVNPGDVLINRVNSVEYLGKSALVPDIDEPTVFESNMMRVVVDASRIRPGYLTSYLQTRFALDQIRRRAKLAVNQASVNQGDIASLPVPLPRPVDQDAFLQVVAGIEKTSVDRARSVQVLDQLDASLLAHAFTGELTAEWRDDNRETLAREAADRDAALKAAGISLVKPTHVIVTTTLPTSGRYADLNREQRCLLQQARDANNSGGAAPAFTITSMRDWLESPLDSLPDDALRRHLDVLVGRGLMKLVSRPTASETSRGDPRPGFGNVYRLVLEQEVDQAGSELARMEELTRLAGQGRLHRVSVTQQLAISDMVEMGSEGRGA